MISWILWYQTAAQIHKQPTNNKLWYHEYYDIKQQPKFINNQQTTNNKQQTTNNKQQTTNNQQPTTNTSATRSLSARP